MRLQKDGLKVAIIGEISGKLPMDALCEFNKPCEVILYETYGNLNEQAQKWCHTHNVSVSIYKYKFKGIFVDEESVLKACEQIVDSADIIYIFCDYVPSSYDFKKEPPSLSSSSYLIKKLATAKNKYYEIVELEKIYHYNFIIRESDRDLDTEIFTIDIRSKDHTESLAKAEAITQAQLKYLIYKNKWDSKYTFTLYIKGKEQWISIDTNELEEWYTRQIKLYKN